MGYSFESGALESIDIDRMHGKAEKIIERSRLHEEDFIEPYGQETIARDLATVKRREESFHRKEGSQEAEMKKVADIFEALILEHGELSNWFGEYATTIKTSKYDDYENGVDIVIEFQDQTQRAASFLGLAADVTFSSDLTKKFDRVKEQIEKGILSRVKYFNSEVANFHGQLSKLPEVIIGADRKTVQELGEMWMERNNTELATHKIQIMVLIQMRDQLKAYASYADSLNKTDIAQIYRDRLEDIERILATKKDIEKQAAPYLMDDSVHASIINFLSRWEKSFVSAAAA